MGKLWISDKLELRYQPDGWPMCPQRSDYMDTAAYLSACESYNRDLAKAKKESIPVDGGTILGSLTHALMTAEPDTFIDYAGEVETGWQWRAYDTDPWQDTNGQYASTVGLGNPCAKTRKVARLKKAEPVMSKYLIQCREIILYIVIDFDPEIGDEFRAGAFDFTVIEKPARSEALFCLEDEYGSVWHAWDYTGNNTCLVAHRLKKAENAGHWYTEGSELAEEAKLLASFTERPEVGHYYDKAHGDSVNSDQRLFNFLSDNGFISLEDDRAQIVNIVTEGLKARILDAFKKKWMLDDNLDPATDLEEVLDDLNIK